MALESDMQQDFGQSEILVNRRFLDSRIEAHAVRCQNSEMSKKNKKIKHPPPEPRKWFAWEWIRHLEIEQTDLAERTGYSNSQISAWVNEKDRFNSNVLHRLANALNRKPWELLMRPEVADDELQRLVRGLEGAQREKALRLLQAADLVPVREEVA